MDNCEDVVRRTLTYKDKRIESDSISCYFCVEPINGDPYIKCKECTKHEVCICVTCFQLGSENKEHKRGHNYCIIDTGGPEVFECYRDDDKDDTWTWEEDKIVLEQAKRFRAGNWEGMPDFFHRTPSEAKNRFFTLFCKSSIGGLLEKEFEGIKFNDETGEISFSKYLSGNVKMNKKDREREAELLGEDEQENEKEIDKILMKKDLLEKCENLSCILKKKMESQEVESNCADKVSSFMEPFCEKMDFREFLMKNMDDYDEEKDKDYQYKLSLTHNDDDEYTDEEGTEVEYSETEHPDDDDEDEEEDEEDEEGEEEDEDTANSQGETEESLLSQPVVKRRRVSESTKIVLIENRQKNVKASADRSEIGIHHNNVKVEERNEQKQEVKTPLRSSPRKSSGSSSNSQSFCSTIPYETVENSINKEEVSSVSSCDSSDSKSVRRSQRLNRIPVPAKTAAQCFLSTRPYFHLNNTTDVDQALTVHIKAEDAAVLKYHPYRDDFDMKYINELEKRSYKYFSVVGDITDDYESFAASDVNFNRCLRAWRRRIEVHSIIKEHDLINKFIQKQTDEKIGRRKYIRNHKETIRGIFDEEKYEEYLHEFLSFCYQLLSGPQFNNLCRILARTEHIMDEIRSLEPLHENGITELPHLAEEKVEEVPKKIRRKKKKRIVYQKSPNKARQWTFLQRMAKPLAGE
uniref:Myb-like domain-containing protein n=1 Tax=Parastrongyloides trichosuri TaxID=131310 RepID=A0A0N4ZW07_PARTI